MFTAHPTLFQHFTSINLFDPYDLLECYYWHLILEWNLKYRETKLLVQGHTASWYMWSQG